MAINDIQFKIATSATAVNGSNVITVAGSVDFSNNYSGTAVFLGDNQPVEAVAGTAPDGSGNSTITLRFNWPFPNVTARLVVFNTIEGLAEAIRRAREVIGNLDEADQTIQDQLERINDNLDLIEDAPTYAQEAKDARDAAQTAQTGAETAQTGAETAETNAGQSATNAATSETNAGQSATNAATSETNAGQSATNAATSETNAGQSATAAAGSAVVAGDAETAAVQAKDDAETAAGNASGHEFNAGQSAIAAGNSATSASQSESISAANANFKGLWTGLTGAANIPYSTLHSGNVWMLVQNLADVTTVEPGTDTNYWVSIGTTTGVAPDSLALGGEAAAIWEAKIAEARILALAAL